MSGLQHRDGPEGEMHHALVVDDLPESREWMECAARKAFPGIAVRQADSLAAGLLAIEPPPQLALVDLGLPDGSGVQLIEALARRAAGTLCVVATVFDDDGHLFPALRAGAGGYLLKDQPIDQVAEALRGMAEGRPPLSPSVARRLLAHFRPPPVAAAVEVSLSARETDVLRAVAKGYTVQQVAGLFALSPHTVAGYLKEVYRKLAVNSRAEATLEAARRGLIDAQG